MSTVENVSTGCVFRMKLNFLFLQHFALSSDRGEVAGGSCVD